MGIFRKLMQCCYGILAILVVTSTFSLGQSDKPAAPQSSTAQTPELGAAGASKPHDDSYNVGVDDVVTVSVWKEPDVSRTVPVRSDGKISLPLAGEVQAAGRTPRQLEEDIAAKLKNFISEPEVTVIVQEMRSQRFNVLGMVSHPGSFPLANSATVLDSIAIAGGFRDFAKQKSIYVIRKNPDGTQTRLPFNYKDVVKGKNVEQNVKLQAGDTVVVP